MRLYLFVVIASCIALTIALVAPLPMSPSIPAGAQAIPASPQCLSLTYEHGYTEPAPTAVMLHPDPARDGWRRAVGQGGNRDAKIRWRSAGADSIDIAWHHSYVLRLPIRGDTLLGRATPGAPLPLAQMLAMHDFAVRAVRILCIRAGAI